jgi:uncharacterized protein (DUF58 family)
VVLTGRAAALALVATLIVMGSVSAGIAPIAALAAVNSLLLAALAADCLRAAPANLLRITREGAQRVRLGETALVHIQVTNAAGRRWRGTLRDAWVPSAGARLSGGSNDRAPVDLAPGVSTVLAMSITPTRRGERTTDRMTLRSLGPLGLCGRQHQVERPWSVRTLPAFASRKHLPQRLAQLRDLEGMHATSARGPGHEFDSLREYVPGDDVRFIDWRASARSTDVMVRTWRPERDRQIVLTIDTGRTSAVRVGNETRLDVALDAALLVSALAGRAGDRVEVLAHDRRTRLQLRAQPGRALSPILVDGLATLEPRLIETDHRGMLAAVQARVPKRSLVVVFTTLERASFEEGFLPAALPLARRNVVIVAALTPDERSDQQDSSAVTTAYRNAALARRASEDRDIDAVLESIGVTVVRGTAESLAPRLADAYLEVKRRGRI